MADGDERQQGRSYPTPSDAGFMNNTEKCGKNLLTHIGHLEAKVSTIHLEIFVVYNLISCRMSAASL